MADSLKYLIGGLTQTKIISSQPDFSDTLKSIDKFAVNDSYKAYLLGYFFHNKIDSDHLPAEIKNFLIDTIKSKNLDTYFYLKTKPENDSFWNLIYFSFFILLGAVLIIGGIIQLRNGNFWYGLGTKYLVPIIREGGHKIILGLVLFVGGLIRLRYEIEKKYFLKSFLASTNNSA